LWQAPSACIVIDANQMGMKMLKMPGSLMMQIIAFTQKFAKEGIDVIIAADRNSRMHTKHASIKRAADREHARIMALISKQDLAIHLQGNSVENEKITELQKLITAKENNTSNTLLDDFVDVLREEVDHLKTLSLDANVTLKVAQYQADPMIARIILEGKADAIISSDADYSVYLGQQCLCVKTMTTRFKMVQLTDSFYLRVIS